MTREIEILQVAQMCACNYGGENLVELAFKKGAEWADAHQPSTWISVEERLPEDYLICKWVAVKLKDYHGWYRGYYSGIMWHYIDECGDDIRAFNVTHWMPIPELQTTK